MKQKICNSRFSNCSNFGDFETNICNDCINKELELEDLNDLFNEHTNSDNCLGNECFICDDYSNQINNLK